MTWVVVNDPIPAGATHLGTGLGARLRASPPAASRRDGRTSPVFEERALRRPSAPTTTSCPRAASPSSTPCARTRRGRFALPADARRGAVRARDVRRDAERARSRSRRDAAARAGVRRHRARPRLARLSGSADRWAASCRPPPTFADVRAALSRLGPPLLDRHGEVIQELRTDPTAAAARLDAAGRRSRRRSSQRGARVRGSALPRPRRRRRARPRRGRRLQRSPGRPRARRQHDHDAARRVARPELRRRRGGRRTLHQKWRQMRLAWRIEAALVARTRSSRPT